MKRLDWGRRWAVVAWFAMTLAAVPGRGADGVATDASPTDRAATVRDVALGSGGTLSGQLLSAQGQPLGKRTVFVARSGKVVARATTDQRGAFKVAGLQGGVYQVAAAQTTETIRLWAENTAPPAAGREVLLVSGTALRGQRALGDVVTSDGFIIAGLIGVAVAVPFIVNSLEDGS